MNVTITPDEYLPGHVAVEVEINGVRGTLTCHESESGKCTRILEDTILNRKQEEE